MKLLKFVFPILIVVIGIFAVSCQNGGEDGTTTASQEDTQMNQTGTTAASDENLTTVGEITTAEEITTVLSAGEVADLLSKSEYTANIGAFEPCGLIEPSNVGIDQSKINEILYPVPDDSEFRKVLHAEDYGINTENGDNTLGMKKLMSELGDSVGRVKVVFPAGVYRLSTQIRFVGLSHIYVCSDKPGEAVTFLMTEWEPCIRVINCNDIQFNDIVIDYETPSAVTGHVVSYNKSARQVVIKICDEFDMSKPCYNGGSVNYGSYMELALDEETGDYYPDSNGNLLYNSTGDNIKNIERGEYNSDTRELTLTFRTSVKKVDVGTFVSVAYTMYEHTGLLIESSNNTRLDGFTVYHAPGMAFVAKCSDGIYFNRVYLTSKPDTERYMTATADGFHSISCSGDMVFTNCVFEKSHDDCMNLNSRYLLTKSLDGNTLTVQSMEVSVSVGDEIEFYSKKDLSLVTSAKVTAVNGNKITFDSASEEMLDCYAGNITTAPRVVIRNCFFGNKRNRGILVQEPNVLIENCTFRHICHGPIQILSVPGSFGEGIMPTGSTVRNCKFFYCDSNDINIFSWAENGAKAPGVLRGVTVTNNYFSHSVSHPICVSTGGGVSVCNNLFDSTCTAINSLKYKSVVYVECSSDTVISDNAGVNINERLSFENQKKLEKDKQSTNVVFENNTVFE